MVLEQQEPLRRFLLSLCGGDRPLADDLAQESFIKAYISFQTFASRSKISTWLFRIAYNTFVDHLRKSKALTADIQEADRQGVISDYESDRAFRDEELYRALGRLSDNEKAVTLLFYMEDKSIKEISVITGMKTGTVKYHLFNARNNIKEYLERSGK